VVTGSRIDPYLGFNFLVEIESLVVGGFSEVTGLQAQVQTQDYQEGGVNEYGHKLAGPTGYPANLTLKHGISNTETLWNWHREITQGIINRRNVSIILLDNTGREVRRWNFAQAYPVGWTGPELTADNAQVAMETLELAHRGIV
jgi:phage tail-like protein